MYAEKDLLLQPSCSCPVVAKRSSTRKKRNNTHKFDNHLLRPLTPFLQCSSPSSSHPIGSKEVGRREEIEDSEMSMRMLAMTPIVGNGRGDSPIGYAGIKSSNENGM